MTVLGMSVVVWGGHIVAPVTLNSDFVIDIVEVLVYAVVSGCCDGCREAALTGVAIKGCDGAESVESGSTVV